MVLFQLFVLLIHLIEEVVAVIYHIQEVVFVCADGIQSGFVVFSIECLNSVDIL